VTPRRSGAAAVYTVLLRLAPASLRARHAAEMEALFLDTLAAARVRGRGPAAVAWGAAIVDLVAARGRSWRRARVRAATRPSERQASMLGSDVRYALRSIVQQKGAATLVVLMLALGIAANVAVFSLINGLFLRPFPYRDADRLVFINEQAPKWNLEYVGVNYPDFAEWRKSQRAFEAIAWYDTASYNLSDGPTSERIVGAQVSADYPAVLDVKPMLGRTFTPEEDRPGAAPVVVLGERLWRERFHADPRVLGRTLRLHSTPYTIIGVVPRETEVADDARLWVARRGDPNQTYQSYGGAVLGRMKPGMTLAAAEADLKRAQQPIWDARDKERIVSPFVRDLRAELARDYTTAAYALFGAVGLLLLVACANVASVMLARALARRKEMAIRLAMGASRWRLVRQLFVENLLLSIVGGVIGLALGRWAIAVLIAAVPDEAPRWTQFGLDARVMVFAVAASVLTTVLFGWAPALHAFTGSLSAAVHATTKGTTTSPRGRRTLRVLVGAECALAALLLVCGGLLLRAYDRVRHVEPGFRADHVLTFSLLLPETTYKDDAARLAYWDRLEAKLRTLPGVERAGLITCPPLGCHWGTFFTIEGRAAAASGDADPVVLNRFATADYFPAMGIRLARGRWFDARDGRTSGGHPAIVNETFVRTFWPDGGDPIGRRFRPRGSDDKDPWFTVVGVARDEKHYGLERPMRPGVFRPLAERPPDSLTAVLHTRVEPETLAATAAAAVRELDPEIPLVDLRTMDQALQRSMRIRSVYSWLLGVFAGLALLLALGGTYGVSAYLVTQRRREMAIRIALGAGAADIFRAVLRGSLAVVAAGVAVGLAGSLATGRLIDSLLFGVKPYDLLVIAGTASLLLATAFAANYWPARRASRVDPMTSLRTE